MWFGREILISVNAGQPSPFRSVTILFVLSRAGFRAGSLLTPSPVHPRALPQQEHLEEHLCARLHLVSHSFNNPAVSSRALYILFGNTQVLTLCFSALPPADSSLTALVTVTALSEVTSEAPPPASTGRTCCLCVQGAAPGCCCGRLLTGAAAVASSSSLWRWQGWLLWSSWDSWSVSIGSGGLPSSSRKHIYSLCQQAVHLHLSKGHLLLLFWGFVRIKVLKSSLEWRQTLVNLIPASYIITPFISDLCLMYYEGD